MSAYFDSPGAEAAKRHLKSTDFRVLDRQKERPKYHLVYLTTHPRGTIEFMEISENLDQVQKHVRASTKQHARITKSGMGELFGPEAFVDAEAGHASLREVEEYWLKYLADGERRVGEEAFANLAYSLTCSRPYVGGSFCLLASTNASVNGCSCSPI
ncbi:MAG: hypothetical protein AAB150_16935, partial [Pseudomonadota bacterium]